MLINRLTDKQRVYKLEDKGFNWLEIADILGKSYEEVRSLAEEEEITGMCEICNKAEGTKSVQISGATGEVEKEILVCEDCLIHLNFREYKVEE